MVPNNGNYGGKRRVNVKFKNDLFKITLVLMSVLTLLIQISVFGENENQARDYQVYVAGSTGGSCVGANQWGWIHEAVSLIIYLS